MSVEDFIELCKTKIRAYLEAEQIITAQDECDIYVIWKDYWTVGSSQDAIKALDNQKAIFGTSLDSSPMFDIQYLNTENKLYMNVLTITDSAEYDTTTPPNA